ncbi:nucleoside-diphosphate sugar epimerase [Rhizobium sp. Leaf321]|jgi:UDP-glucose 4-epimerase|uniref:NAD-dependent epimerase/dehydratase family protein n=1 Tax=Rhizobium sp. Leaf321 TaxID=1736335 RepID=UPI00071425E7|nr:NAD(P)-dependent oxidoreductase [Rhizobium sp. Leaf321]KQQ79143.1 nucleoside-diphosphate sugar epimerase [Rhizobium sp. Leaf321]
MTRILMTGGAGFLGGWILKALKAEGHDVRIFDRSPDRRILRDIAGDEADHVEWFEGDITDGAAVKSAAKDCASIIHLAALLTPACKNDPVLGATVNLIGTLNAFEAAKANGIARIAYASSAAVFGPDDGSTPHPVTHYGAFKLACEGSARAYWADAGISSIGLRPTVVYGPGRESGLTAGPTLACREAVLGNAYTIGYSGPQDLVFVADVAAAFAAAATRPFEGAHAFSVGGACEDVPDVIAAIRAEIPGANIDFGGPAVPMAPDIKATDNQALLGPIPVTLLRQGISQTIAHYRSIAGRG